jgi:hypothetical protein
MTRINGKHSPTFESWRGMMKRCSSPTTKGFENYGGRGIRVCRRWQKFKNFLDDMGERPDHHTLDRIDNDGNYEPGNVRWATASQQNSNRRRLIEKRSRIMTAFGKTLTIAEWSRQTGISPQTLYWRANQGWPPETILRQR